MLVQLFETVITNSEAGIVADVIVVPSWAMDLGSADDGHAGRGGEHSVVEALVDVLGIGLSERVASASELPLAIAAVLGARSAHEAGERLRDETAPVDDDTRRACEELAFTPVIPVEESPLEKAALAALLLKTGVLAGVGGPAVAMATGPLAPVVVVVGLFGAVVVMVGKAAGTGFVEELQSDADALGRRGYRATRDFVLEKLGFAIGTTSPVVRQPRNASIEDINEFLQNELGERGLDSVSAVEAARWLEEANLLPDDPERPGVRLRYLLRTGQIRGGEQVPRSSYGRWYVYRL